MSAQPPLEKREPSHVMVKGVPIISRVVDIAEDFDFPLDAIADAVLDPETSWPGANGVSRVYLRGVVAAVVPDDEFEVIACASRDRALVQRSQPRQFAVKSSRGGGIGRRTPSTMRELMTMIDEHDLVVARQAKHYVLRKHGHSDQVSMPATPSDVRSIPNLVGEIRRAFGVDVRDVPVT